MVSRWRPHASHKGCAVRPKWRSTECTLYVFVQGYISLCWCTSIPHTPSIQLFMLYSPQLWWWTFHFCINSRDTNFDAVYGYFCLVSVNILTETVIWSSVLKVCKNGGQRFTPLLGFRGTPSNVTFLLTQWAIGHTYLLFIWISTEVSTGMNCNINSFPEPRAG